jgi:hypothetical protein
MVYVDRDNHRQALSLPDVCPADKHLARKKEKSTWLFDVNKRSSSWQIGHAIIEAGLMYVM